MPSRGPKWNMPSRECTLHRQHVQTYSGSDTVNAGQTRIAQIRMVMESRRVMPVFTGLINNESTYGQDI